ncbi:MAG: tetratricopeptide (TPR) repeat protein [Saprospiraceae bacterium]|jgi:tetratricopeptide (TPR) repeat protein
MYLTFSKFFFLFSLSFFSLVDISAQDNNSFFVKANESSASKDYQQAVSTYQQLLKTGVQSAEVEYNLGNAYLQLNQVAESILHYERALTLEPNDNDILQNLRLAQERIENNEVPNPPFFLSSAWNGLQMSASSNLWSFLFLLFFFAAIAGLILWQIGQDRTRRKQGFFAGLGLFLLSLVFFFLAAGKSKLEIDSKAGIVMQDKTDLHAASEQNSPVVRDLSEGVKVTIFDNINNWYKVKLANGEEGWLPAQAFEKI